MGITPNWGSPSSLENPNPIDVELCINLFRFWLWFSFLETILFTAQTRNVLPDGKFWMDTNSIMILISQLSIKVTFTQGTFS